MKKIIIFMSSSFICTWAVSHSFLKESAGEMALGILLGVTIGMGICCLIDEEFLN